MPKVWGWYMVRLRGGEGDRGLFLLPYLFIFEFEWQRDRMIFCLLVHAPNTCMIRVKAMQKLGDQNSVWFFPVDGRDPNT